MMSSAVVAPAAKHLMSWNSSVRPWYSIIICIHIHAVVIIDRNELAGLCNQASPDRNRGRDGRPRPPGKHSVVA
jgi:hypothetical protein